jgi:transcriptional regulator with XRE-family HTH domain
MGKKKRDEANVVRKGESTLMPEPDLNINLPMGETGSKSGRRKKKSSVFAKNFSNLLKEKGVSVRRAAEIAGTSASVVSGWTAGAYPGNPADLLKITTELGADFQFILCGVPSSTIPTHRLNEIFDSEDRNDLSGIFLVTAKRLRVRK